nr:AAA family ATPase [Desulfobulbaceae bacterium]
MKINSLRFANLNSLKGDFCIDFNSAPLSDAGIFAITGPTGAGKTTVLDAVAIALYGQTPRLHAGVSGKIMSRQAGECFAEVEFSVDSGLFRSRWSRKRAHGRANGTMQNPKMELSELGGDGARIIEDQIRSVIAKVEKLTGLDFNRFSRSVMLAQGNFASFLQAKGNERAELLEKMTGTEIYSLISIEAFERTKAEKNRLDQLQSRHSILEIMPGEKFAQLLEQKGIILKDVESLQQKIEFLQDKKQVRVAYDTLLSTITAFRDELVKVEQQQKDNAEVFCRLDRAEVAMPMQAAYASLKEMKSRQQGEMLARDKVVERLTELSRLINQTHEEQERLSKKKVDLAEIWAVREREIAEADKIDQRLALEKKQAQKIRSLLADLSREEMRLNDQKEKIGKAVDAQKDRVAELQGFLADNSSDLTLGNILTTLTQQIVELKQLRCNLVEKQQRIVDRYKEKELFCKEYDACAQMHAEALGVRDLLKKAVETDEKSVVEKLAGQTVEKLDDELTSWELRAQQISEAIQLVAERERLSGEAQKAQEKLMRVEADIQMRKKEIAIAELERSGQLKILSQLEEKQKIELLVKKYEDDRKQLSDGDPCPLCGALDHPWGEFAPVDEALDEALTLQRSKVETLTERLGNLTGMVFTLGSAKNQSEIDNSLITVSKNKQTSVCDRFVENAGLAGKTKDQLVAERSSAKEKCAALSMKRVEIREIEARISLKLKELMAAGQTLSELNQGLEARRNAVLRTEIDIAQLQESLPGYSEKLEGLEEILAQKIVKHSLTLPLAGEEDRFVEMIQAHWQAYDKARTECSVQMQALAVLEGDCCNLKKEVKRICEQRTKEKTDLQALEIDLEGLLKKRYRLLPKIGVDEARNMLSAERDEFNKLHTQLERKIGELAAEQKSKNESLVALDTTIQKNKVLFAEGEKALVDQVSKTAFESIEKMADCFLENEEFVRLRTLRQGILDAHIAAKSRLTDAEKSLLEVEGKAVKISLADVLENLEAVQRALSIKQQELGAISEILKQQEVLLLSHKKQAEEIGQQQKECERWQVLNELLGSADGKKYRRFAQGLTLEHLLGLANRQLVRLNDRYLLQRGQDELEIEVVDTFQADTVRSTETLSGGEEFLVSLALALGLANLAGSKASVDSLFLDEGFGTLDTETLETAIAALASLHETGKTIGVISHVDALKERIPVQIQIQKGAGGFSVLSVVS